MSTAEDDPNPLFSLEKQYPFFNRSERLRKLARKLDRILGLEGLSAMPASIPPGHHNPYQAGREFMEVTIEGREAFEKRIPKSGPTIVVANHPLGAHDALVASELALASRPDSLVFGNAVLDHPCQKDWFLPLEIIDESPAAARLNLSSMRRALAHLKSGGCIVIFPAGEVERWRWPRFLIEEGQWTTHLARLAQKSGAAILPLGFPDENPLWFHLPGAIHPTLRLFALPRAFLALRGKNIAVRTGKPLLARELPSDPIEFTNKVRERVLHLAERKITGDKK